MIIMGIPCISLAQHKDQEKPVDIKQTLHTPPQLSQGLQGILGLDPSKLHVSHSYDLSYFSLSGQSFAQGLYLNTMQYQFSDPLQFTLQWGVAHSPLGSQGVNGIMQNGPFISAAQLRYKPSKNLSIGIEYNALPYYYMGPTYRGRNSLFFDE